MKSLILFDDDNWNGLLPLTFTRPICELRVGILTIREKWERHLGLEGSHITQAFLSEKYPIKIEDDNIIVNSSVLPDPDLVEMVRELGPGEALLYGDELLAARLDKDQLQKLTEDLPIDDLIGKDVKEKMGPVRQLIRPYDLFTLNGAEIMNDFRLMTSQRKSYPLSDTNRVVNIENIFLEEGAEVEFALLNAQEGPIYIGKNARVMEGAIIRGPFSLGDHAVVKMAAKIYGETTIGPYSNAGGEIKNSILMGYANKGHDGYLGNSVIGEWCNIGADTNTSNLKNNYDTVRVWNYITEKFEKSGLQFCGLIMGDHTKCGINTMFNTGTVVGVGANIYGSGYPRAYIPSFTRGGAHGFTTQQLDSSLDTAKRMYSRKGVSLTQEDINILKHIFYYTAKWRNWE